MAARVSTVDDYVAALPDDVRPLMERIRRSIRAVVPDVGETISYSMPTFTLDGRPLVHVAVAEVAHRRVSAAGDGRRAGEGRRGLPRHARHLAPPPEGRPLRAARACGRRHAAPASAGCAPIAISRPGNCLLAHIVTAVRAAQM